MVDTYETEARDFMIRNNIKMSIIFKDREANRLWRDNAKRNRYSIYIKTPIPARLCALHFGTPYITQHTISRRLATTFSRV